MSKMRGYKSASVSVCSDGKGALARSRNGTSTLLGELSSTLMRMRVFAVLLAAGIAYYPAAAQLVGTVRTLAGGNGATTAGYADGVGTAAQFNVPVGVAVVNNGAFAVVVRDDAIDTPCVVLFYISYLVSFVVRRRATTTTTSFAELTWCLVLSQR